MEETSSLPSRPVPLRETVRPSAIKCSLFNAAVLILGVTVYSAVELGTPDYLPINLLMGAFAGVILGLLLYVILLIPFSFVYALLCRFRAFRHLHIWLYGPSVLVLIVLLAKSVWICLPAQRLMFVARGELDKARDIHVTGSTGFLAGDWVAVCQIDEVAFLSYCLKRKFVAENTIDIQDQLKKRSPIRSAKLIRSLPVFKLPLQFSRLEGENERFGIFALYDRDSNTAVLYRYFHD